MIKKRYPYGFRITARLKAWIERRRGYVTSIRQELVKADGTLLTRIAKNISPVNYAAHFLTWPDALMAWTVYAWKLKEIS